MLKDKAISWQGIFIHGLPLKFKYNMNDVSLLQQRYKKLVTFVYHMQIIITL